MKYEGHRPPDGFHGRSISFNTLYVATIAATVFLASCKASQMGSVDVSKVYREAVTKLKHGTKESGFWIGDVTELFRMGVISREVAEADTAPLTPLVAQPKPFHGYFLRAMTSGPALDGTWTPIAFAKGKTGSLETFGVCVYPAVNGEGDLSVYLVCPLGVFRKTSEGTFPILDWPGNIRGASGWSMVD